MDNATIVIVPSAAVETMQRGGSPISFDRLLGHRLGAAAAEKLAREKHGVLVGHIKGEIADTLLAEVVVNRNPINLRLPDLARILATEEKQKNRRKG